MNEEYFEELEKHNRKIIELLTERKEIDAATQEALEGIKDKLDLNVNVEFPDEINVANQKDLVFPDIQKVKVENQVEIPDSFEVRNLKDLKLPEFPDEIRVSNFPKQDTKGLEKHLTTLFTGLWDAIKQNVQNVFVRNKNPEEAIPVRLVTAEGKEFYTVFSGGGSGGGGTSSTVTINSEYAEDAAHTTGDTGSFVLAVRNDTLAALAGTDGDYAPLQVDGDGALYTIEKNLVDTNNTTTSTLAGDAVYTGTGTEVLQYASIVVFVEASHDSATDGLSFEFSTDNSNWDKTDTHTYVAADGGQTYVIPVEAQFFRVVYTNGATGQTHFRLETILHANPVQPSDGRMSDNVSAEKRGVLTKSAIIAQAAGSGDFVPVQSTNGGSLKISLEEAEGLAGQTTMANSVPVVVASDQSAISVDTTSDLRDDPFNQFGEDTGVVSETETTIASYTVPAGKTANIEGFLVNGSASGRYKLKVAGSVKAVARTSAAQRTVNTEFNHGVITAAAGQAVIVTGFHEETANQTMDANVFGFLT